MLRLLPVLFFFSGASSLVFEMIFTRLLTHAFGNTAYAVSTVLAAFLGGLAVGATWIGRWADRRNASLWTYGTLELLVGVYCLFTPELFGLVTWIYVGLHHRLALGSWAVTTVRFGLAAMVILVPTALMGGTLPVLARCAAAVTSEFRPVIDRLYAWNTLGAALGTLAATYFLVPALGVRGTIVAACSVNGAIFLAVAIWASKVTSTPPSPSEASAIPVAQGARVKTNAPRESLLLLGAFLTGVAALAYEVVWTHILSFLIGNTVYAFGIMLFTFLCGLGMGAHLVARHIPRAAFWARALAASQLLLGVAVFATMSLWNYVPAVFSEGLGQALALDLLACAFLIALRMSWIAWKIYRQAAGSRIRWRWVAELAAEAAFLLAVISGRFSALPESDLARFMVAEGLRFFCAFYLLIVPCLLVGLSFPLLLNLAAQSARRVGASVGHTYAANTLGTVLGSVLTGFVVLPALGSLGSLRAIATLNLLIGWGFALFFVPLRGVRRVTITVVAGSLAALFWLGPVRWDPRAMTSGAYVYFSHTWDIERVLYFEEDVQGGLTSVVQTPVGRVLLSNGKFQGNDSGEVGAQARFAMIPILFMPRFDRALVIGLGTGHTLQVVSRFPFRRIDVAEIAPRIVDAARQWFQDVNCGVFDRDPRVNLSIVDGRNFLLLSRGRYDLITVEITSIWVSGAADLYNREFYELCRNRLSPRGVLQQWVQLHNMRPRDLLVLFNTAAHVFPHAAFFVGGGQGLLITSPGPLEFDYARIASLDTDPGVRQELDRLRLASLSSLLGEIMLDDQSFREILTLLPSRAGLSLDFVSSDNHPYLEYETPVGNTANYNTSIVNMQVLKQFQPALFPPGLAMRNLSSEDDANLLSGYVAEGRGEWNTARDYFLKVKGPARPRAETEIARLAAGFYGGMP
ncbi:MAG: fused MFS/spermidine synthase [Acidobacteriia bacterium]|nr:fused MFS/spermidine synthase [Terriglobia bacterium]